MRTQTEAETSERTYDKRKVGRVMRSGRRRLQAVVVIGVGMILAGSAYAAGDGKPSIKTVTPVSGPAGTTVKIRGAGLSGAEAVTVGGVKATYKVSSPTLITASVPNGAATGKVDVITKAGTATSPTSFRVVNAAAAGACGDPGTVTLFAGAGANTLPGGQSVNHGQGQVYVQFTYTAGCTMSGGVLAITVPSDWTQPVLGNAPGCTTATLGKVATGERTITVSGLNLAKGGKVAVVYGQLASYGSSTGAQTCAFGDGVSAPSAAETSTFTANVARSSDSPMVTLTQSPTLAVN